MFSPLYFSQKKKKFNFSFEDKTLHIEFFVIFVTLLNWSMTGESVKERSEKNTTYNEKMYNIVDGLTWVYSLR